MDRHRILLYTLSDERPQAEELLERWDVADAIELVSATHDPFVAPTSAQLDGVEAAIGEFMAVKGGVVGRFRKAGVKLVASMSIGLNHMDVAALAEAGIVVTNCPGYCAQDVALHAMALLLDLERKVTFLNREVLEGTWEPKDGYVARRTHGQTLGLVFFGHIAKAVVPIAKGLGMDVIVWAPTKGAAEIASLGAEKVDALEELLRRSDAVSLHCPLIAETRHLLNDATFAQMKPGAFLINTARGDVVDEEALLRALDSGRVRAAGLDTIHAETTHRNPRLVSHPRVVVTPHCAYDSLESRRALIEMTLSDCVEFCVRHEMPAHAVNLPVSGADAHEGDRRSGPLARG